MHAATPSWSVRHLSPPANLCLSGAARCQALPSLAYSKTHTVEERSFASAKVTGSSSANPDRLEHDQPGTGTSRRLRKCRDFRPRSSTGLPFTRVFDSCGTAVWAANWGMHRLFSGHRHSTLKLRVDDARRQFFDKILIERSTPHRSGSDQEV